MEQGKMVGVVPPSLAGKQLAEVQALAGRLNAITFDTAGMQQGKMVGVAAPSYAGKQPAEVEALAGRLNAITFAAVGMAAVEEAAGTTTMTTIKVMTLTGRQIQIQVAPTDPVGRIKECVEYMEGIPTEHQRLILGGKQLVDSSTLQDSNVVPGCVIHLVVALRGGGCHI